jgi:GPH family glycoside/pentoside/hexuronide:cation symporter
MNQKLSIKEIISYALGNTGYVVIYMVYTAYLTMYYTDVAGLDAAAIGTMMLLARIFDGVSDLMVGHWIDRTNTRWGKARPWIVGSVPFLALAEILVFSVPGGFSGGGKMVYATVTYIFLTVVMYTICNMAFITLLPLMTTDAQSRTKAANAGAFIGPIAVLTISYVAMNIVNKIGWTGMAAVFALIGFVMILICGLGTKERTNINENNETIQEEAIPVKESLTYVFKNKYFILFAIIFVMNYIVQGLTQGSGLYFARDVMGDVNYFGTFTLCGYLPMFICAFFLPTLTKKFGKWKVCMAGFVLQIIGYLMVGLFSNSFALVCAGLVIKGIGGFPMATLMYPLLADVIDYGEYKFGKRVDGMTSSCVSFGTKVGTGIGSALLGWGLNIGGYVGTAAVQSASTVAAIRAIYSYVPMIFTILGMVVYSFANLDKISTEVQEKIAANRAVAK